MKSEATTLNGEHLLLMDKVVFHYLIILSKKKPFTVFNSFNLKTLFFFKAQNLNSNSIWVTSCHYENQAKRLYVLL